MKTILITLIIELITALLLEALLEALRNIEISTDPPAVETWLGPFGIRIDFNGIQFLHGLEV